MRRRYIFVGVLLIVGAISGMVAGVYWYDIAKGAVNNEVFVNHRIDKLINVSVATTWSAACIFLIMAAVQYVRRLRGVRGRP
jgi:hypothetical protein